MINLNTPLGEFKKTGIIKDVIIEEVFLPNKGENKQKACLIVDINTSAPIRINEAYVEDYKKAKNQQGFWITLDSEGKITYRSTIGRFMRQHNASSLKDLIGTEIKLLLGNKNLLVGNIE